MTVHKIKKHRKKLIVVVLVLVLKILDYIFNGIQLYQSLGTHHSHQDGSK